MIKNGKKKKKSLSSYIHINKRDWRKGKKIFSAHYFKIKISVCAFTLLFFLLCVSSSNISKVQLITQENRLTIGKESHEKGLPQKTEIKEYDQDIPENNIIKGVAQLIF